MNALYTALNNEDANWGKPSVAEPDPLPSQKRITKAVYLRLAVENQPSRPWLGRWIFVLLGLTLYFAFVFSFLLMSFRNR